MTLGADRLTRTRWLLREIPRAFDPDPDKGGDKDPPDPDPDKGKQKFEWSADQQAEISRIVAREARAAAKRAREERDAELEQQRQKDDEAAQLKKQQEAGEFEEARKTLEAAKATVEQERDQLKAENAEMADYVTADIAAVTTTVQEATDNPTAKALLLSWPGDDAPATKRLAWAKSAKPFLESIKPGTHARGNGEDPPPSDKTPEVESPVALSW